MSDTVENIEIFTWKSIWRLLLAGLGLFLAWKAIGIFVDVLIAVIFSVALHPLVQYVHKKLPWMASIIIVIASLFIPFVLIGMFAVPDVIREVPGLNTAIHSVILHASWLPESVRSFDLVTYISQHSGYLVTSTRTIASYIATVIEIIFLVFYFLLDYKRLLDLFLKLFPNERQEKIKALLFELAVVNGKYLRGNLLISLICGIIIYVGLALLKIPFALPVAVIAAILDLLPLIGSAIAAVPAIALGFSISPLKGVLVIILYILYQQIENGVISPAIYNKALNISPALSFLAVVVGAGLFGILGAFLALPFAASIPSLVRYVHDLNSEGVHQK